MSFSSELRRVAVKAETRTHDIFVATVAAAADSIVNGSPVTGAPGQPVDTGALKASWQTTFESRTQALIATKSAYAIPNEEGIREDGGPYVQRSPVGGRHSVKQTIAGMPRLIAQATRDVTGGDA